MNCCAETYKNQAIIDIARIESTYPDGSRHQTFLFSKRPLFLTTGIHD